MRFLADENVPHSVVRALADAGHDVSIAPRGADDEDVLRRARGERRILLTRDKDFGRLVFAKEAPAPPGIVLIRAPDVIRARLPAAVLRALSEELVGCFTVIGSSVTRRARLGRGVRRRP